MWEAVSIALTFAGLVLTAVGAAVTAKAVIGAGHLVDRLAGAAVDRDPVVAESLTAQSRSAKTGLWMVAGGLVLQVAALTLRPIIGGIIVAMNALS